MKQNNELITKLRRSAMVVLVAGTVASMTGCMTANMKVSPAARIQNVSDKKLPLSVGLMLDNQFCTNTYLPRAGGFIYPFGPVLKQQGISLCEQSFEKVTVSTNSVVPAGVDATLTPEMHRCGIGHSPQGSTEDITLLLQWTLRTGDNQQILWVTTVDGRARNGRPEVFQLLFDDLATKSYRAFQESPEIKRLIAKKSGTDM